MYLMFIYINKKPYNGMGIKGTLEQLQEEQLKIAKEAFKENPNATFETKFIPFH